MELTPNPAVIQPELPPPNSEPELSVKRANWALFFATAGFLILARVLGRYTGLNPYWSEVIFFCILPILLVRREGLEPVPTLRVGRVAAEHVGLAVGVYALSILVVMAVTLTTLALISRAGFSYWDAGGNPILDMPGSLNQSLFFFAVVPAICEEMFFRGYLMRAYSSLGIWRAVFFNSLLFGLLHGSIIRFPVTFTLGVILSLLALKTGSLIPSMVLHFVNNAVAVMLTKGMARLVPQSASQAAATNVALPQIPLVAVAIVAVIGMGAGLAVWAIIRPEQPFAHPQERTWTALKRSLLTLPVLAVEAFYIFLNFRGLS